jgi:hypothetical protein
MNIQEKRAWFYLAVIAATLAVFIPLAFATGFHAASLGALGLFGFAGGASVLGRREKRAGRVVFDERDKEIDRIATLAGYSTFWTVFVLGVMIPFFILGPNAQVTLPINMFPAFIAPAMMIIFGVRAVVVVVLHRRGSHE